MSHFLCKSILFRRFCFSVRNPNGYNHQSLKWVCSSVRVRLCPNARSITVSYLMNSLGFSLEASEAMSKRVSFRTSCKPDKAIDFLTKFGFAQTQIPKLIRARPELLVANTERIVLPKLQYLESKGISRPDLTKSLSVYPNVLISSLEDQIIPTFEYLKPLFPSDAMIARAITRCPDILVSDFEKYVLPNVSALQSVGVSDSNVAKCIAWWGRSLFSSPVLFRETVEEVSEMGFNPVKVSFLIAVYAKVHKLKWESKVRLYKKLGWSENDVSRAFLKFPWCMIASEDKITLVMDFFVREMGFKPIDLADCPAIISYNLKKRIIPRVRVFQALVSKGLLKEQCNLYSLVKPTEKVFLQRYVTPYEDIAPEVLEVYADEKVGSFGQTIEN